jgi:hypothetical protein
MNHERPIGKGTWHDEGASVGFWGRVSQVRILPGPLSVGDGNALGSSPTESYQIRSWVLGVWIGTCSGCTYQVKQMRTVLKKYNMRKEL